MSVTDNNEQLTKSYRQHVIERLKTPHDAGCYLAASLLENADCPEATRIVIQDICEAFKLPFEVASRASVAAPRHWRDEIQRRLTLAQTLKADAERSGYTRDALRLDGVVGALENLLEDVTEGVAAASSHSPASPVQPLCAVHQRLESTNALECEVGNDCVACSLNERRELLQLIAPFAAAGNTEDSVTVMRRVAEFYATHAGEGRVIVSYPAAIPAHKCERCDGTGEVEGYGGNKIYCGHCAGTGKKPDFATPAPLQPEGSEAKP